MKHPSQMNPKEMIIKSKLLKFHRDIKELEELEQYELCQSMLNQLTRFIRLHEEMYPDILHWNDRIKQATNDFS